MLVSKVSIVSLRRDAYASPSSIDRTASGSGRCIACLRPTRTFSSSGSIACNTSGVNTMLVALLLAILSRSLKKTKSFPLLVQAETSGSGSNDTASLSSSSSPSSFDLIQESQL